MKVRRNEKVEIEVVFRAESPVELKPQLARFSLEVLSGPCYTFGVKALARIPRISLSQKRIDFGQVFVMKNPLRKTVYLEVVNYESKAMTIETLFVRTSSLDVQLSPGEVLLPNAHARPAQKMSKRRFPNRMTPGSSQKGLQRYSHKRGNSRKYKPKSGTSTRNATKYNSDFRPNNTHNVKFPAIRTPTNYKLGVHKNRRNGRPEPALKIEKIRVPIVFSPRNVKAYREKIVFVVNNNCELTVTIKGEGVKFQVAVETPRDAMIDFKSILVGQESMRRFVIKNHSKAMAAIDFDVRDQLANLKKLGIVLTPDEPLFLGPKISQQMMLRFRPVKRMTSVRSDLLFKFSEDAREVFKAVTMQGSSQGFEIKVVEDTLSFGDVVAGSSLVKTLTVCNVGDINAQYFWDTSQCARNFSIVPVKGVLSASEDFGFSVKFHPQEMGDQVCKAMLRFTGFRASCVVTLVGSGVGSKSDNIQTLKFETETRTVCQKTISIKVVKKAYFNKMMI